MSAADNLPNGNGLEEERSVTFGKYRLVRKLAAGGMAQLYLASIDGPDGFTKTCVIKRILPQFLNQDEFSDMFVTEAKVAALLNHPNVVQVFDFGKLGDQYYLAMEYIDGPTLDQLMVQAAKAGESLGPHMAVHLGIPMCDALGYIHSMTTPDGHPLNLVHRDVTPGNILISHSAEVKVTDFGVVKSSVAPKSTQAGVVKGKFAYMSPEQALGRPLDHRSDLFSLGVVLYEIATGKRLWKRGPPLQMIAAVSRANVPRPSEVVPGFPLEVERILLKALARHPDDRYESARDMLADLDAFRSSQRLTSGRRELTSFLQRHFPEGRRSNVYAFPGTGPSGASRTSSVSKPPTPPPASLDERSALPEEPSMAGVQVLDDFEPYARTGGHALEHASTSSSQLWLGILGGLILTALFWLLVLL